MATETTLAATVVIPTIAGRGPLLRYAVESALAQTVAEIEVFVIGDGVGEADRQVIEALREQDGRIRFFDYEKHERRGEPNRHAALAEARGEIVTYLTDRDIMLSNHIAVMQDLLREADFAHTLIAAMRIDGSLSFRAGIDLATEADRRWILELPCAENGIPLSFAGHRLEMYRKLPHGWRTTPPERGTDVYMWEQFLAERSCRALSGDMPTILYFPRYWRENWSVEDKVAELEGWRERMAAPDWPETLSRLYITSFARERLAYGRHLRRIGEDLKTLAGTYNAIARAR